MSDTVIYISFQITYHLGRSLEIYIRKHDTCSLLCTFHCKLLEEFISMSLPFATHAQCVGLKTLPEGQSRVIHPIPG